MNVHNAHIYPEITLLFKELETLPCKWTNIEDAQSSVSNIIEKFYKTLSNPKKTQETDYLNDPLYLSVENLVMETVHEKIFSIICIVNQEEDRKIFKKCTTLCKEKVTADQLGAMEEYSIPLPAAIVELASLDMHLTPTEKLTCLSAAFDLALAELKGAIVDILAISADDKIPVLNVSDITPILATVIIHAKPIHLISNLYYIEHFKMSDKTKAESECLTAFKAAVHKIKLLNEDLLSPKSQKVYCDMKLEDVLKVVSEMDAKYNRKGERISLPANPLENFLEQLTHLISISTLSNSEM